MPDYLRNYTSQLTINKYKQHTLILTRKNIFKKFKAVNILLTLQAFNNTKKRHAIFHRV